jgi:hypothetical protein
MSRFTFLTSILDQITVTQPGSLVVIAGNLNAKVGTEMPMSTKSSRRHLAAQCSLCPVAPASGIRFERKQRHPDSDFAGKLLNDMCQATHLISLSPLGPHFGGGKLGPIPGGGGLNGQDPGSIPQGASRSSLE